MTELELLQMPLSEIEMAELVDVASLEPKAKMLLRRLAYELDTLREYKKEHNTKEN